VTDELKCVMSGEGDVVTLAVAGEVDVLTGESFETAVITAVERSGVRVDLDLAEVAFMGSEGITTLVRALRRAEPRGVRLHITAASRQVQMVLDLTGIAAMFE